MINYEPEPGIALVKLIPKYSGIKAPEKSYDSIMEGEIIKVGYDAKEYGVDKEPKLVSTKAYLVGRIGYWRQFKDDLRLTDDYAFIEIRDILGTSERGEDVTHTKANNK